MMMLAKFENAIEHNLLKFSHQSWSHEVRAGARHKCEHQELVKGAHSPPRLSTSKGRSRIQGIW